MQTLKQACVFIVCTLLIIVFVSHILLPKDGVKNTKQICERMNSSTQYATEFSDGVCVIRSKL